MRKKAILIAMLGCCALVGSGQQVTVTSVSKLLPGTEVYSPVLNASGTRLLYASGPNQGLAMLDLTTRQTTSISNENCAGIDAKFGADGRVYYVTQQRNDENLIYRTGRCYDVATARNAVVLEAQHGAMAPEVGTRGVAINGPRKAYASQGNIGTAVRTQGSQVLITVNGRTRAYSPVHSDAGYLWASLSPRGDKVAFFAAGKGIVVIDLNGQVLARLGNYEMPCWYDENYLVAQHATDDGHQFTSSQIMLLKADGTWEHALTAPTSMTMQPTSAAGKIAYTTIDGQLSVMTIDINE